MIKRFLKIFKNIFIFLVITGVVFSNIPFYALTELVDSYEKTSGIVDKVWLLQNEHQSRVVDNFSSLRNLAEKMKVREARAAVSVRNVGAYVSGTANLTPVIPATAVAGDMMLLAYGTKPYNDAPTINQGWISIGSATDGTVAAGVDVGSMQTSIYYKEHTGSETNPTITNGTNNVSGAAIIVFQKGASETWETPVGAGGGDATAGTGFSVTASANPGITLGDMLVGYAAIRSDAGAQSAIGITATGLTVGAFTEYPASDLITTSGGDMAMSGGYHLVTAGTASAAPVYASTLAAAHTGSAFIVRLRATTPADTTPPTPNPMTFATPPANFSVSQIDMTATTATDATTPPVSYFFTLDNSICAANAGTGGTSSAWQAGTAYSDTLLQPNQCYGYTVKARDSAGTPNETTASGISSAYTSANVPGTPTLSGATVSTLNLTNAENSNPAANPTTNFAVQVVTTTPNDATWINQWVNATGNPSATAVWLTDAQLDALVLQGLQGSTLYGVKVKARNQDTDETALSAEGQGTTSAPTPIVTTTTTGTQTVNIDAGATGQYLGGAWRFQQNSGSADTITALTISDTGTINANLNASNATLRYSTANAGTCSYAGTETIAKTGVSFDASDKAAFTALTSSIPLTISPNYTCVYLIIDAGANAVGGNTIEPQITAAADFTLSGGSTKAGTYPVALGGITTVRPNVTDATDSALADGGRNGETFTITGTGFGTVCGSISVQVAGLALTCNSANNTTISATVPSAQVTTFGGTAANGLLVTVGGTADDARLTYYVYPNITSVSATATDAARELESITLNGTRFDTNANPGTVYFTGGFGSVAASVTTWGDTGVIVTVPAAIADNIYTGDITLTRAAATGSKTDLAYGSNTFRILPKIASTAPVNLKGGRGDTISITGDHLCQSGVCPSVFSAANSVNFTSGSVTSGSSTWTDTSIPSIVIPGTATDGNLNITSNTTYTSNNLTYDIKFAPTTPTNGVPAGQSSIALNPTINSSAFSDGTDADTHLDSEWQIDEEGTFVTPEWSETLSSANVSVVVNNTNGAFAGLLAGQTSLVCGKTYSFRERHKDNGGVTSQEWSGWATASTFNTISCGPDATSVSYQVGGDGGRSGYSATITGAGFGTAAGGSRANCAGGAGTGCVRFVVGGNATVADADVTAWTDTSISFTVNSALASDGGALALQVVAAGVSDGSPLNFYIYPTVSSYTATFADGGYQDGTVTINGDHLGSSGATTNISFNGTNPASVGVWNSTSISTVDTPDAGTDSGTITVTRASDSKASNASSAFYIYPQVTGISAATFADGGYQDGTFTLSGNHFGAGGVAANISINGVAPSSIGTWAVGSVTTVDIPNTGTDSGVITLTNPGTSKTSNNSAAFYIYPQISSYTASKGDGDVQTATITISGNHFGAGGTGANISVNGVAPSSVGVWGVGSVTAVDIPNTGTDSGVITLTNPGTSKTSNNSSTFYIYPQVTSISNCETLAADAAREYSASDAACPVSGLKDGQIHVNGNHFGTPAGANPLTILGVDTSGYTSWTTTLVSTAQVPVAIVNSTYIGDIVIKRSDNKTHAYYGGNVFRILPRIASTTPVNLKGGGGDTGVSIAGDHLCQSGTCPTLFSAANSVNFIGGSVTSGSSTWTDTSIPSIVIPGTATDGALNITSNTTYTSNNLTYDIKFAPATPTNGVPAGQSGVTFNPTINSSAFSDGTDGDTHLDSEWQIDEEGTFVTPEWSETLSSANISVTVNNTNGTFAGLLAGQTALACSKTYSFRERHKDNGGVTSQEWSGWATASTFNTVACGPNATSISNSTEGTLTDGGRISQTIVITGTDFIGVTAGNRATCAGGAGTGCVKIGGTGGQIIADAKVTAWGATSITIQLSLTDLTTTYGGATTNGLMVYVAGVSDSDGLTFYIYPDITSLTAPLGANTGAREYASGDTDGVFTIIGNKFGTGPTSGSAVIVGGTVATFVADGTCDAADGWAETCIKVQVPTSISDSTDSGYAIVTQGAGTSNKVTNSTDAESAINIWPRVTGISAATQADGGYQNGTFTLNGSHFGASAGSILVNGQTQDGTPTWGAASITGVGIPNAGTDSGSIVLTKSDAKTSNSWSTFYIYPQITGFTAAKGDGDIQTGTITISGNHFGTSGGNAQLLINTIAPSATTPTWGAVSITNVDIPNTGANSGVVKVTNPQTTKQSNDSSAFYIYPQITSVSNCETLSGDTAREYNATDAACPISGLKDGEIHINGNHFGATAGTLTILGTSAPTYVSWGASLISTLQVPIAIADDSYTGSIALTRSDATTSSYTGFRIAPRIISLSPSDGAESTSVTVIGNHLCQAGSANCPNAFSYTTPISNVLFGTTNALAQTPWGWENGDSSATGVKVKVPAGAGIVAVKVISGVGGFDYESNAKDFSYVSTAPTDPTNLRQFKPDGVTQITIGAGVNSNSVILKGDSTALISINMVLEVEVKQTYIPFDGAPTALSAVQGPGTVFSDVAVTVSGLTDGLYHWRARAKNSGTNEVSNWISFGGNADGVTDFYVDTTGPVISSVAETDVSDIQATIIWNTDGSATQQVAYGTVCPTAQASAAATFSVLANKQPESPAGSGTSHSVVLSGLIASKDYYYMVRSADAIGNYTYNPSVANSCNNFTTTAPRTRVMKTLEFYIEQLNTGATSFNKTFDTFISESKIDRSNIFIKSVIIEVFGISKSGTGDITVIVNLNSSETSYVLADPGANSTFWKFAKNASSLNFDCVSCTDNFSVDNSLVVSVSGATSTSLLGAKAIITYYYEPL
ncbi:MAG: hypothetical protein Q8N37_04885 [bacterium]|nr:hypothetical protein [bacterium]